MKSYDELFVEYLNEAKSIVKEYGYGHGENTSKGEFVKMLAFYRTMKKYEDKLLIDKIRAEGSNGS